MRKALFRLASLEFRNKIPNRWQIFHVFKSDSLPVVTDPDDDARGINERTGGRKPERQANVLTRLEIFSIYLNSTLAQVPGNSAEFTRIDCTYHIRLQWNSDKTPAAFI